MDETNLNQSRGVTPSGTFTLQNSSLSKVRLEGNAVRAKLGSMPAYEGKVRFDHRDGGPGRFFKKALTGEGVALMVAGRLAGGAFDVVLQGTGKVAVTTQGDPVPLDTGPHTSADPDSAMAWSGGLRNRVKSDVYFSTLLGRDPGGAFRIAFEGPGWALIQPSEGPKVPPHTHARRG